MYSSIDFLQNWSADLKREIKQLYIPMFSSKILVVLEREVIIFNVATSKQEVRFPMPGFIETSVLDSYKQESSNKNLDTIGGLDWELDDLMREDHKTSVGGVDTLICAVDDNA